jgi:hypothetical protein
LTKDQSDEIGKTGFSLQITIRHSESHLLQAEEAKRKKRPKNKKQTTKEHREL